MNNFVYYAPTEVVFGKGAEEQTASLVSKYGGSRVAVIYGGQSAKKSGLIDRILDNLQSSGIEALAMGGVVPNPLVSTAREMTEQAKAFGADFILAVGGGSVIDTAKCISYGLANEGDVWDFYAGKRKAAAGMPIGAVLTIAAAGSEMSNSSVITKEEGMIKRGYSSDFGRCRFAVMDPQLTMTLPAYQTASGCVDIIMHTMERYFTKEPDTMLTDQLAEGLIRTVMENARVLMREPDNYNARAQVMWAGSLAHNGLLGCGMAEDWASHQLEHELSASYDVAHGAGLAAVWGSWARYVMAEKPERFAQYAVNVMGVALGADDPAVMAEKGIRATEQFFREIGMPTNIRELGIELSDEEIEELARKCSNDGVRIVGGFKRIDRADMVKIYHMARG